MTDAVARLLKELEPLSDEQRVYGETALALARKVDTSGQAAAAKALVEVVAMIAKPEEGLTLESVLKHSSMAGLETRHG